MTTKAATPAAIEIPAHLPPIEQYEILLASIKNPDPALPASIFTAESLHHYHRATIERMAQITAIPFLSCSERRGDYFAMYQTNNPEHLGVVLYLANWSDTIERMGKERPRKTNRAGAGLEESRLVDGIGSVISISVQGSVVALGTRAVAVLDQIAQRQEVG